MLEFNELKADILQRAREKDACKNQYNRALKAETKEELLQIVINNLAWCYGKKMLDTPYMIENFRDLFEQFGIYVTGHHEIENRDVVLLGNSSATIEMWDNSSATIEMWDNSSATIKTFNNSSATIKTCNNSSATIEMLDNSSSTIETRGNSSATIETCNNSSATIKTWDNSSAAYELKGNFSTVKDLNKSKLFVKKSMFEIVEVE
jgi:hypothetical protein